MADTTYLSTNSGWMYLATVIDRHSRRILGWSVSPRNDTALILEALKAAVMTRGTSVAGIIHHSDRGSTYAN
ncbi:MAG: DDE-type integrase/transposase/recombinase [Opitutaceae bacterium]|nr:DDE-type integrase/transposase/recombinase [Opitutaceae bacterium]